MTGLTFSAMAYFTQSILPAVPVHAIGLLVFFVRVWPSDPERPLVYWRLIQVLPAEALESFGSMSHRAVRPTFDLISASNCACE